VKKIIKYWPVLVILVTVFVYYWKVFLKGLVPFPGDIMVGAYLPWLESKWGTTTGVAFKANSSTPDVYSQFYLWKSLIAESFRQLQLPFWNPYSYSGYPLLANFHSGALNPFNLLMVFLGDINGWSMMIVLGSLGCFVSMYLLIRELKLSKWSAIIGAFVYAFSGFSISWSVFINAADALVWLPLMILVIHRYFERNDKRVLYSLPIWFFLFFTAGHFQIGVYGVALMVFYTLFKILQKKNIYMVWQMIPPALLSLGIVMIQLVPTLEMAKLGIRFSDSAASTRNFGLSPLRNLINLLAPDFFGNPVTMNFWGFFNYHETIFYSGLLTGLSIVFTVFIWKKLSGDTRFFWGLAIVALLFGFDTVLGRAIYLYKVPGISTSDAGRIASMFVFGASISLAAFIENAKFLDTKKIFGVVAISVVIFATIIFLAFNLPVGWMNGVSEATIFASRSKTAVRNLMLPGGLLTINLLLLILFRKKKYFPSLIFLVLVFDIFRFGWKYTPFVPKLYMYPETPQIEFLKNNSKAEPIRIDREKAEILPNATWMAFRLMSPSGYDPMALKGYVLDYEKELNKREDANVSRYSEIDVYDAAALGKFNVKYLMVTKRDKFGKLGGENINRSIDLKEWKSVYSSSSTAILENTKYQPRVRFLEKGAESQVTSYKPNEIKINFQNAQGKTMIVADTWYPGWRGNVNNSEVKVTKCEGVFRCVKLDEDSGELIMSYTPSNFEIATVVSIASLLTSISVLVLAKRNTI